MVFTTFAFGLIAMNEEDVDGWNRERVKDGELMLKLKLQYFGHLMQIAVSFEKTLMLGKIGGGRRRG